MNQDLIISISTTDTGVKSQLPVIGTACVYVKGIIQKGTFIHQLGTAKGYGIALKLP